MLAIRAIYSQRDNLDQMLVFLSRDLERLQIDHTIVSPAGICHAGTCQLSRKPLQSSSKTSEPFDSIVSDCSSTIDRITVILTSSGYQKFCQVLVHQRFIPCTDGEVNSFWDSRTGYTFNLLIREELSNACNSVLSHQCALEELQKSQANPPWLSSPIAA
jgi:hypothetical protein